MARKTPPAKPKSKKKKTFFARHPIFKGFLAGIALILILLIGWKITDQIYNSIRQSHLKPFYNTAGLPAKGRLGQVIRKEPLGIKVDGGKAFRVLYRTQQGNGNYTFSSGIVFIPSNSNAGLPRPVVAWAHGTLGLGDKCAPSRTNDPMQNISWVNSMLQKGWVVTATDYAGFGTPGTQGYLVGGDEAHDVLNSVRAARDIPEAHAGSTYVVFGHSQGGNSVLFAASEAASYAPELHLIGTVAAAPAAELVALLNEQYGTLADWVIGPLVTTSWPAANPALHIGDVLTASGRDNYKRIANQCIAQSVFSGMFHQTLGQKFFSTDPLDLPAWKTMAQSQSAPILNSSQPLMIIESKTDKVVLPDTTSLYIQASCKQGANLSSLWLNNVSHMDIPEKSASNIVQWIGDRFAGRPNSSTCSQTPPVTPASATQ